jgi:hypothetical protein
MAGQYLDAINRLTHQPAMSSTTLLGSNASFSSGWQSTGNYGKVCGGVYSDKAGTLFVYQGPDGANATAQNSVAVSAGTLNPFIFDIVEPYFQITYTNGATAQGGFRLSTNLRRI